MGNNPTGVFNDYKGLCPEHQCPQFQESKTTQIKGQMGLVKSACVTSVYHSHQYYVIQTKSQQLLASSTVLLIKNSVQISVKYFLGQQKNILSFHRIFTKADSNLAIKPILSKYTKQSD